MLDVVGEMMAPLDDSTVLPVLSYLQVCSSLGVGLSTAPGMVTCSTIMLSRVRANGKSQKGSAASPENSPRTKYRYSVWRV